MSVHGPFSQLPTVVDIQSQPHEHALRALLTRCSAAAFQLWSDAVPDHAGRAGEDSLLQRAGGAHRAPLLLQGVLCTWLLPPCYRLLPLSEDPWILEPSLEGYHLQPHLHAINRLCACSRACIHTHPLQSAAPSAAPCHAVPCHAAPWHAVRSADVMCSATVPAPQVLTMTQS